MRILCYARDPGSANVIIPVVNRFNTIKGYSVLIYAKDYAVSRLKTAGFVCDELIIDSVDAAILFLHKTSPDVIITGSSLDDYTERYLWKASDNLSIPSYAIMDQWILLGIRFSRYDYNGVEEYRRILTHEYYPRRILVMDDFAAKRLMEDGVSADKIAITGQPHFDDIRRNYDRACFTREKSNVKTILFASEPKRKDGEDRHLGYSERTIFENVFDALQQLSRKHQFEYHIVIRPHPREDADSWSDILNSKINVSMDKDTDSYTLMKNVDLVCGMSSMFLVEAAICKVPIVSCLIGLKSESPFVFDLIGAYNSSRTIEELYDHLKEILVDGKTPDLRIDFIEQATEKTVKYIMEDMQGVSSGD